MGYDGFISYSHAADGRLAPVLQQALQRFAKPWNSRRALRLFRDETGLSTNPHLWSAIETALDDSEWFVLLASPEAAQSEWVNREIAHWLATKSADRILPVVTDGDWIWDSAKGDFTTESTAVPNALRAALRDEPRHLDLSWARAENDLDLRNSRFRSAVADLAAPMHGVAKDELEGEDIRQHRRIRRLTRATGAVLVVLTLVAAGAAVLATRNARQARDARDESDYQRIVAQSLNLKASNRGLAMLLAVEARHLRDTPQSRGALQAALIEDPRFLGTITPSTVASVSLCPLPNDRDVMITAEDGTIRFVNIATGHTVGRRRLAAADPEQVASVARPRSALGCAVSANGASLAVFSSGGSVWSLDPKTYRVRSRRDTHHDLSDIVLAPDGGTVAAGTGDGKVLIWPTDKAASRPRELASGNAAVAVAFSPDGARLASSTPDRILVWDTKSWAPRGAIADPPSDLLSGGLVELPEPGRTVRFSPDGRSLADGRRAVTRVLDVATGKTRWTRLMNGGTAFPVAFGTDSRLLYTGSTDAWVEAHDVTSGVPIGAPFKTSLGSGVALTSDGSTLLAVTYGESTVDRYALDGRSAIGRVVGRPGQVPVGYSPSGRTLLTRADSASPIVSTTEAWDTATGRHIRTVPNAAFARVLDDRTVGGYFLDRLAVDRLDLETGRYVGPNFAVRVPGTVQAATDPAGDVLIAYGDGSIVRYEPDGTKVGSPWLKLPLAPYSLAISRHGLVAISTNDDRTLVYDLRTGKPAYAAIDDMLNSTFSPNGDLLGGITAASGVIVRDARTGASLAGPNAAAEGDYVGPDFGGHGTIALMASTAARLFDLHTAQAIGERFPSTQTPVLRPDGLELATSNENGVVLWDLDPDHWERAACKLAGRNLTHREWATYFPNAGAYRETCRS